jgi:hypothetical protein
MRSVSRPSASADRTRHPGIGRRARLESLSFESSGMQFRRMDNSGKLRNYLHANDRGFTARFRLMNQLCEHGAVDSRCCVLH